MNLRRVIRIGRLEFFYNFALRWRRGVYTIGIYDICKDGKHILFLDYDTFRWDWLIDELKFLQNKYKLSDFYIFESSAGSYHAVCFDKLPNYELHLILRETNVDESFYNAVHFDYGSRVLRLFPKGKKAPPRFVKCLESRYNRREKSLDHIETFELNYGIRVKNRVKGVSLGQVYLIKYYTEHSV